MRPDKLFLEQYRELKKKYLAVNQGWNLNAIKLTYDGAEVSSAQFTTGDSTADTLTLVSDSITYAAIDVTDAAYNTLQEIVDAINSLNTISMGVIASQSNTTNAVSTLGSEDDAGRFVVGDKVTFWDVSGDALSTEELVVSAVDAEAKTVTCTGVWSTPPSATDILVAKAGTVASYSAGGKTVTLSAGDAARFVAGDIIAFTTVATDDLTPLRLSTDTVSVVSVDAGGAILNLSAAFVGTPSAADIVVAVRASDGDLWGAELGDQFEGTENSNTMAVNGSAIPIDDEGDYMPAATNLQIKKVLPAVPEGVERVITAVTANTTYNSGSSAIQIYVDDVKKWEEGGGATTVAKDATFGKISAEVDEEIVVKVVNSGALTAGYLSVSYEQKDAMPYTVPS